MLDIYDVVLIGWLLAAVWLLLRLRVVAAGPLANAPARRSLLSLPVVGIVIVAYFFVNMAVLLGAVGVGAISMKDLAPPKESDVATQPATIAGETQPGTAASQVAETSAATTPDSAAQQKGVEKEVTFNVLGTIAYALTLIPVLIIVPLLFPERLRGWGLHVEQLPTGLKAGLVAFVVVFPLVVAAEVGVEMIYDYYRHHAEQHPTIQALDHARRLGQQIILNGVAVVVAPVVEEIFFRGILQTTLIQYGWGLLMPQMLRPGMVPADYRPTVLHRWVAIGLASAFFAMQHQMDAWPVIFVLALGLGYVYERTGILWASIVLHVGFNSAQLVLHSLQDVMTP